MNKISNTSQSKLENVISLVSESEIASVKGIVSGLIAIINDPRSTVRDLKELIELDPPLTARILKVANSAYYAPRGTISDIEQAVIWLGFDTLKEIALSQKIAEIYNEQTVIAEYSRQALWEHSIAVALIGKLIYRREFSEPGDTIYAIGLLHDIGIIITDQFLPDAFRYIFIKAKMKNKTFIDMEEEVIGVNHSQIGAAIAAKWVLPEVFYQAIAHHHTKDIPAHFTHAKISMTLYVANFVCQDSGLGFVDASPNEKDSFNDYLNKLGLKSLALKLIVKDVKQELKAMKEKGFF